MIAKGLSKQEVYEKLCEQYRRNIDIAEILKPLTTVDRKRKYGVFHLMLLAVFISIIVYEVSYSDSFYSLIWYGAFSYLVIASKISQYFWISIYQGLFVLLPMLISAVRQGGVYDWQLFLLLFGAHLLLLLFPIWLQRKTIPPPKEKKEVYTNKEGKNKVRIIYSFID